MRLGILTVIYNNSVEDLHHFVSAVHREAERAQVNFRHYFLDNSPEPTLATLPADSVYSHSGTNLGYTAAANRLMAEAFADGCEAIITMNADGFPLPGCIENLMSRYAALGGNALIEARQFPEEHPKEYDRLTGDVSWVSGCCLLVGRNVYELLGSFDENMFLYCEDVDYSFRARSSGLRCLIVEDALFYHPVRNRAPVPTTRRHAMLSNRYLARKWGNEAAYEHFSRALVEQGFFESEDKLPALPADMEDRSGGVPFDERARLTFAARRWSV